MYDLSRAQSTALFQLFEAGTPLTIGKKTATALQTKGYAQQAKVWPIPTDGFSMAITTKGRSLCIRPTGDEPDVSEPESDDTNDLAR